MDRYEEKKVIGLAMPVATIRRIKRGRVRVNLSEEIRRLVEIGLQVEAGQVK